MLEIDQIRWFTDPLNVLGARYIVTGGVAGSMYGEPRTTLDVDIVLELPDGAAERFCQLFNPTEFYCPPVEIVKLETLRPQRGHFNVIHMDTGFKADIYLRGRDPLHEWALDHARKIELEGYAVWVAPPEYVIIRKLQYFQEGGSEKHLRDIRGMLRISPTIDREWLERKIAELGLERQWKLASDWTTPRP